MSERDRPILLIEDSEDDAELAQMALRQAGVSDRIVVARDGEEALDYLFGESDQDRSRPRLVLLDVKLPKVDGFEVLRRIRQDPRTRTLPVVMLSSSDVHEDIERAYDLGVNSYVCKPVEFSAYSHAVTQLGTYWVHVNQAADQILRKETE
jgi:two-component system response regulator